MLKLFVIATLAVVALESNARVLAGKPPLPLPIPLPSDEASANLLFTLPPMPFTLPFDVEQKVDQKQKDEQKQKDTMPGNMVGFAAKRYILHKLGDFDDPMILVPEIKVPIALDQGLKLNGFFNGADFKLAGNHEIEITKNDAQLDPLDIDFVFELKNGNITGNYEMEVVESSFFPIPVNGKGILGLTIEDVSLGVTATGHKDENDKYVIDTLDYALKIEKILGEFDGLYAGLDKNGKMSGMINKGFNAMATPIFNMAEAAMHDKVVEKLKVLINEAMQKPDPEESVQNLFQKLIGVAH